MSDIAIHFPAVSDDRISNDLCRLTELAHRKGHEISAGFLGGEFGYGAHVDNDVFMMHPFCWCESSDCAWCVGCDCGDDAYQYFIDGKEVSAETYWSKPWSLPFRRDMQPIPERQCGYCKGEVQRAPNFLHKASGARIEWYKYIGRSMEVDLKGADWSQIMRECRESLEVP